MSLEINPDMDKGKAKPIILAGDEYLVAPLSLRNILALADMLPKLQGLDVKNLTGAMFDPLIDMAVLALKPAYPSVSKDVLLDMTITPAELVAAVPVVVEQAGGQKVAVTGEAAAASPSTTPTGAGSSQTS